MAAALVVVLLALVGRLVYVQGVASGRYAAQGRSELLHNVSDPAARGSILDSSGDLLAVSIPQETIVADPAEITDPQREAAALSGVLGVDEATLQARLSSPSQFAYVARQVSDDQYRRVRGLGLPGISFVKEPKRFTTASGIYQPVLGHVGIDGQGLSGIEYQYQNLLGGRPGRAVVERGSNGAAIPGGVLSTVPGRPGQSLQLTLSRPLQYEVQTALSDQIQKTGASGGTAVVMNSRTGAILAMVDLTAGQNGAPPSPAASNTAATAVFEPGSVMKTMMLAGALQDHLVDPSTLFSVPDSTSIYGDVFHDAESHPTEALTTTDILAESSNVGAIGIANQLGAQRLSWYLRDLGFGRVTGLRFPGESAGLLNPVSRWSGTSVADITIGQDEAVTAIQLLDAYNAIANGGVTVSPRLVQSVADPGGQREPIPAPAPDRVISQQTAEELTSMLQQVVGSPKGTGTLAAIPGYDVAGKTGTAQIPLANGRGYQPGAYMATFVGFVPAQKPALTTIVVLDHPTPIYGGAVAAPVFAEISQYALRLLDVPPPGGAGGAVSVPGQGSVPATGSGKVFTD